MFWLKVIGLVFYALIYVICIPTFAYYLKMYRRDYINNSNAFAWVLGVVLATTWPITLIMMHFAIRDESLNNDSKTDI